MAEFPADHLEQEREERRRKRAVNHLRALESYIEEGGTFELEIEPALHHITPNPLTIKLTGVDRNGFLEWLPHEY